MSGLRFDGRVAVVTGAGRGIGRSHALQLAARGAQVVVADLGCASDGHGASSGPADSVVEEILAAGGAAVGIGASVADEEGAASIVQTALDAFGRLDIVINNAGIFRPAPFEELSVEDFRSMMDVHFFGTLLVTRAAWPHLEESGSGRIVNTVSEAMLGRAQLSSYGAAKGAIFGLTRNLAAEGAPLGIRANCLAPRAGTRMADDLGAVMSLPPELVDQMKATMPAELVSPAAVFLAHDSCELNGEVLQVGSGTVQRLTFVCTPGFTDEALTPEHIVEQLGTVMEVSGAQPLELAP